MNYELLAFTGWLAAALMVGLWFGERGRRRSAERWAVTGSPHTPKAVSMAPSKEAEDRFTESVQEYSKETVDRGVKQMMADARTQGIEVSEADIRRDVENMLLDGGAMDT